MLSSHPPPRPSRPGDRPAPATLPPLRLLPLLPPTLPPLQVKRRCRWLLGFSQGVLAALPDTAADPFGSTPVDANALGWALGVVTSRAFRTRGPGQPAAMLPLIDMANHSFSPNARVLPAGQGGGGMCLVATRDLEAGEPVLISYGEWPTQDPEAGGSRAGPGQVWQGVGGWEGVRAGGQGGMCMVATQVVKSRS